VLKLLLAAALLGSSVGVGGGTLAAVVHGTGQPTGTARVKIALGKPGPQNRLRVPGVALAAGDRIQRPFELLNTGTKRLSAVALTTTARPSSALVTDRVSGLRLRITRCSTSFKRRPTGYSCPARTATVLSWRPVIGAHMRLSGLAGLPRKGVARLMLTLLLPAAAPNSLQGKASSLTYVFTAV
jgi:hypothetical protein